MAEEYGEIPQGRFDSAWRKIIAKIDEPLTDYRDVPESELRTDGGQPAVTEQERLAFLALWTPQSGVEAEGVSDMAEYQAEASKAELKTVLWGLGVAAVAAVAAIGIAALLPSSESSYGTPTISNSTCQMPLRTFPPCPTITPH